LTEPLDKKPEFAHQDPESAELDTKLASEPRFVIPEVELFRAGDYGSKGSYSVADLERIAQQYRSNTAPVTLDHSKKGPAYGWVKSLRVVGDSLLGTLSNVPKTFMQALRGGQYKKRSVEIGHENEHHPILKAVSFLGAAIPRVAGMKDIAFEFRDDASVVAVPWASGTTEPADQIKQFRSGINDANAGGHGALSDTVNTRESVGHSHVAYLDDDGSGFTDFEEYYDADRGYVQKRDGHQHSVSDHMCSEEMDENGILHTHGFYTQFSEDEDPKKGTKDMSAKKTDDKTNAPEPTKAGGVSVEQFAALEDKFAAAEKRAAEASELLAKANERVAEMQAERENEKQKARFERVWDTAIRQGRARPGDKDRSYLVFSALPLDDEKIEFSADGKGEPRQTTHRSEYLDSIVNGPVVIKLGRDFSESDARAQADASSGHDESDMSGPESFDKRAREIAAEKDIPYNEAFDRAVREKR